MGKHQQVLGQVQALRDQMDKLPAASAGNESVRPWNVRETTLDIGRSSAQALGEWQQCLDLNAAILASLQAREASEYEIIRRRYNDARPLIELGRLAEAERILLEAQQAHQAQSNVTGLQKVLTTRAILEDARGRPRQALELQQTAIRLAYVRPEPCDIAINHDQLAHRLHGTGADLAMARAHRLAAALLYQLTGMAHDLAGTISALVIELRQDASRTDLPATVDEIIAVAERTEGVRLGQLLTVLQPNRQAVDGTLADILHMTADMDHGRKLAIQRYLDRWEPVIAATVAAANGDTDTTAQLAPVLEQFAQASDWAALAPVLRRVIDGERDASLLADLNPIDTAIATEVLTRLAQQPGPPAQEQS